MTPLLIEAGHHALPCLGRKNACAHSAAIYWLTHDIYCRKMIGCRFCCLACPVAGGGARRRDQNAPKASCSAVGALWKYAATLVLRQTDRFNLMCSLSHHFPSMQSTTRVGNTSKDFDLMPRYDLLDRGLQRQVEAVARLDASFWHQVSTYNRCVDHKPIILNTKLFWVTNEI